MEFRLIFDTIPEEFDRWRPRYCPEVFADLAAYAELGPDKRVLEIGPGTGQATEPVLDTGCRYLGVELGEHLAAVMRRKFGGRENFSLICDDFVTCDLSGAQFDLIYSAATIQWIDEEIAFPRVLSLLRPGGVLAMMLTKADYRTPNPALYEKIQEAYSAYFHPNQPYTRRFGYTNAPDYGFTAFEKREYHSRRVFTADEYVAMSATHCDHIVLSDEDKQGLFGGMRQAILEAGNRIELLDTIVLYLARKPE
jgi:SAM-dependent methyltransferase